MVRILANPFALSPSLCPTGVCSPEFPLRGTPWRTTFPALRTLVEVSIGLLITHATSPEFPLPRTVPGALFLVVSGDPAPLAPPRATTEPAPSRQLLPCAWSRAPKPSRRPPAEPSRRPPLDRDPTDPIHQNQARSEPSLAFLQKSPSV